MFSRKLVFTAAAATIASFACAGFAIAGKGTSYTDNSDTAFSVGIQYDFGDMQAELVAGVRRTTTDTDNDVTGAKLDLSIPLTGGNHAPTLRGMGLAGTTDVQGEFGAGYDFGKAQPLVGAGVQGPYVNGGINYYFGGLLAPYIGANSLKDAPSRIEFSPVC